MVIVYSTKVTNRLRYIFELYFEELLKVPVSFTSQRDIFEKETAVKLNYSNLKMQVGQVDLRPHGLLFQTGLEYQDLSSFACNEQLCVFASSADSFLPFDPFAAGFFLVTRYEEYLERQFGKHGRYLSKHSILSRNKVLDQPVVNQWARLIAQKLQEHDATFVVPKPQFDFLTTIDIDNAWAYKHKSLRRVVGASLKNLFCGNFSEIQRRLKVWKGADHDPYDTYDYIRNIYKENEQFLQFFFLLGKPGRYDRNVSARNEELRELIRKLASEFKVGIHPSFRSNRVKRELFRERKVLEEIIDSPVHSSRQHYLKLILPVTYRRLIKAGIREDYTMGYSECIGFRAGIASPFFFYDLKEEQKTNLRVFPFQSMDISLRDYMGKTPEEALTLLKKMMVEINKCGGTFISLWHNESLSDEERWEGWRMVFEEMTADAIAFRNEQHQN
ncbi:polysaccharide deacetylase family protein [Mangrovibacterium lignilyticum]|uniref:polysaccharide deacetylase family protein n=1 Tax=Mangrovibacterium lignilyticum TaxID=2668052 RepID=UPI0013CF9E54|nr:polysaccharide deacetylase family protein [Mangrovibacterium lignilyticum]